MQRWFRMYEEILDDPKVQKLPDDLFKAWVNVLALSSRNGGKLGNVSDCAFALRLTDDAIVTLLDRLLNAGLIDRVSGGANGYSYAPHSWDKRQYKSDSSTSRVKRFREKSEPLPETAPETDTEADTETDRKGTIVPTVPASKPDLLDKETVEAIITAWNNLADDVGLAKVQHLSDARRKALKLRLKELGGLEGWYRLCNKIRNSSFLTGKGDSVWKCSFDWVLKSSSVIKVMEGNYDDRSKKGSLASNFGEVDDFIDDLRRREDAERQSRG